MSKTTFDPNAKATIFGEGESAPAEKNNPAIKASSAKLDTFEAFGGSTWKALKAGSAPSNAINMFGESDLQNMDSFLSNFGKKLENELDSGIMGSDLVEPKIVTPFTILPGKKPAPGAYIEKFEEVVLPPSLTVAAQMYSSDPDDLKAGIDESRAFYQTHLDYNTARLANATKGYVNGKLSPANADILKQFIGKLTSAINFTNDQMRALDEFEKEKLGEKDI